MLTTKTLGAAAAVGVGIATISHFRKREPMNGTAAVVGLGYAGANTARSLAKAGFKVIGINDRPYFGHNIAAVRSMVSDDFANKFALPLDNIFQGTTGSELVIDRVQSIEEDPSSPCKLVVKVGQREIRPDYLVIATGTQYNIVEGYKKSTLQDVVKALETSRDALKKSTRVTVVGGGAVGVELAGEIAHFFPEKKVTLVHSESSLISNPPGFPEKFKEDVAKTLHKAGVEVVLGERVLDSDKMLKSSSATPYSLVTGERIVKTSNGREIPSDLVYFCMGAKPKNGAFSSTLGSYLNGQGRLTVNEFLQVKGFDRVFAAGDIADIDEMFAVRARFEAKTVARNIESLARNQALKAYSKIPPVMLVTAGPNMGAGVLPFFGKIVGDRFVSRMKGKDMFVSKNCEVLNAPVPK